MPKFTASLNLPKYATAPSSPVDGDVYYNTTDHKVYSRINGAWVDLAAVGSGSGDVTLNGVQTLTNKTLTDPKVGGILTVDNNTASPIPVPALEGIMAHLVNGDTSSSRVVIDSHGSDVKSGVTVRRSRGTAASPTAIQSGDVLGELGARGYGSSQFPDQSTARVLFAAAENFTDTANGTKVVIHATANGSVTASQELTITAGSGGGLDLPTSRSYKINNTDVLTSSALGSGVLSSSLTSVGTITTGVWNASSVPLAFGGTGATSEVGARTNILPSQTGNSGKFLKTDGSDVQWATALTSVSNEVIDGGGA